MLTAKQIIKEIGVKHLSLVPGKGYWYFVWDNCVGFQTHSVYVVQLKQLSLEEWVAEGKQFLDELKGR